MQAPKKTTAVREGVRAKAGLAVEPLARVALDQRALDEGRKPLAARLGASSRSAAIRMPSLFARSRSAAANSSPAVPFSRITAISRAPNR